MRSITSIFAFGAVLLCVCCGPSVPRACAQDGVPLWTNRYDGPGHSDDYVNAVAADASGRLFITGQSADSSSVPSYATVAYASTGEALWTNHYNGTANIDALAGAVALDRYGSLFVTGYAANTGSSYDFATFKYASEGIPVWTNLYNGPGNYMDYAVDLVTDYEGNAFVSGYAYVNTSSTIIEAVTVKYSGAGAVLWTRRYRSAPVFTEVYPAAMAADAGGNVCVTGAANGWGTDYDFVTIKYSSAGDPIWTNRFDGYRNNSDSALGIAIDDAGDVYVAGETLADDSFDIVTIKYSASGAPMWTNYHSGVGEAVPLAIATDGAGKIFVNGFCSNSVSGYDHVTIAYSSDGEGLWTNRYRGPADFWSQYNAIGVDNHGNVFVTGAWTNSGRGYDFATVSYAGSGVPLWTNRYDGPDGRDDLPRALTVDPKGDVHVAGFSAGANGDFDYLTIKYSASTPPVQLDFQKHNNQLVLSWASAGFGLQSAPFVSGTFTNILGATSPCTNSFTGAQRYFRLKSNYLVPPVPGVCLVP